jgi:penicillin-binding protein 2
MDVRQRLSTLLVVTICLFGTLFARVAWLQTAERQQLELQSSRNTKEIRVVPAPRGRIFDRSGNVLVDNKVVAAVTIKESLLPSRKATRAGVFERLSVVLGVDAAELLRRFQAIDDLEGVEVARNVSESAVIYLAEHAEEFPGVSTSLDSQRVYPQGKLAPHILGYVGDIGDDLQPDRQPCNARYSTGDKVGKAGIERSYECVLRGMPGLIEYTVDRENNIETERWISVPQPGADVRLTIDPEVQRDAEKRLRQALLKARQFQGKVFPGTKAIPLTFFKAPAGAVVVYDAKTGAVVAMASYPDYDPSEFVDGISAVDFQARYGGDDAKAPLTNRAIAGQYAPGSTAKPFVAASALNNGLISRRTTINDEGTFEIPNCPKGVRCTFRNAGETPHGPVDLERSLVVSSDVFYYQLGYRYAAESWPANGMQDTYKEFGFGGETGIGLPNEKSGRIPTRESFEEQAKANGTDLKWRTGNNLLVSIGQGEVLATPLQLAVAYGALVNDAQLLVPRIAFDTPLPPVPTEVGPTEDAKVLSSTSVPGSVVPGAVVPGSVVPVPTSAGDTSTIAATTVAATTVAEATLIAPGRFGVDPNGPSPEIIAEEGSGSGTDTTIPGEAEGVPGQGLPGEGVPGEGEEASPEPVRLLRPVERLLTVPEGMALTPKLRRSVDLSRDVQQPLLVGLRGVVNNEQGTAYRAFSGFPLDTFPVGGKTGTAQVSRKHDSSLFVGFGGPDERFVIAVVLEEAGFGNAAAAPLARKLFEGLNGAGAGDVAYLPSSSRGD